MDDQFLSSEYCPVVNATAWMAEAGAEERGAVFTRREVVEFILDLSGYTVDLPLHQFRLLEPSFGHGDFLLVAVERLLTSYFRQVQNDSRPVNDLSNAICAVEIHRLSIHKVRTEIKVLLIRHGVTEAEARQLLDAWIIEGDFLLVGLPHTFTHALGNPPYVRQESIPDALIAAYRARYSTIYDRADLYIPFIERCLASLEKGGALCLICSDRWMKNKYGGPLREMVAHGFHLAAYVDMVETDAFLSNVIAYPAITLICRGKAGATRIAHRPAVDSGTLSRLSDAMRAGAVPNGTGVVEVLGITKNREPWILQSFDQLAVVRRLEREFPAIEDTGCKIGIGVATGADAIFIGRFEELDVETSRKLPLVTTTDIKSGTVKWKGLGVINSFEDDGNLVDLTRYPRLRRYIESHAIAIKNRNCAKKNPRGWYRTIDRIYPELTNRPKLLIPDIKGVAHIVYEGGQFYPHHNLYFITSDEWDLRALQTVLVSGIAKLFVSIYSTKMRGGYLRFQAQYLRRIRLPQWGDVSGSVRSALISAGNTEDIEACNRATFDLYRMTEQERVAIGGNEGEK
jgi:hypothetical protein